MSDRERHLAEPKEVVWLIGAGRSGTTWASDLINWDHDYQTLFEPFHRRTTPEMSRLPHFPYCRSEEPAARLRRIATGIFSGGPWSPSSPPARRRSGSEDRLLIKEIRANLFASWAARSFPWLKIVLLIRNPFAVAWSKYRTRNWKWMNDPQRLLAQPKLRADYLRPFETMIRSVGDDFVVRQVMIWAILHYVPLLQFRPDQVLTAFYEDLVMDPHHQLSRVIAHSAPGDTVPRRPELSADLLNRPSWVTDPARVFEAGKPPADEWRRKLSARQIEDGRAILRHFELDAIYGDGTLPDRRAVDLLLERPAYGPGPVPAPAADPA